MFQRLIDYEGELLALEVPVVLAGDYNVMPTELDVYTPEQVGEQVNFLNEKSTFAYETRHSTEAKSA